MCSLEINLFLSFFFTITPTNLDTKEKNKFKLPKEKRNCEVIMLLESIFLNYFLAKRLQIFRCLLMQNDPSKDQHTGNKLVKPKLHSLSFLFQIKFEILKIF